MRELKRFLGSLGKGSPDRRTPPGVRELKLMANANLERIKQSRTPPGVRELKLGSWKYPSW